jgi:hypothetical protein
MHPFAYLMENISPLAKNLTSNGQGFFSNSLSRCTNKDLQH